MRFVQVTTALLVIVLVSGLAFVDASAQPNLKEILQERYAAMKAAMADRDTSAMAGLLSSDFISIDITGKTETADQMIAGVNGLTPDPNKTSSTTLISMIQVGGTATVEQRHEMHSLKSGPDRIFHQVELVTLSTDMWIELKDVWLISKTMTDDLTYSVDGKVVVHKVRQ
jgi:hypothetical protein